MTLKAIRTDQAPQAIGAYSQAIDLGDLVFVSGQIPLNPNTMKVVDGDITQQTAQVMKNMEAILHEADLTFANVAKFTIYITNMEHFSAIDKTYEKFLSEPYPARATIEVSKLPKGVGIEIDAIAKR